MKLTRREFVATTALGSASLALDLQGQTKAPDYQSENHAPSTKPKAPVIICAANGYNYLDRGYAVLTGGGDTLDAVMQVITGPEDDPNDDSVGLGGLPNEDCVVELDCLLHAWADAHGGLGRGRGRYQERVAAGEDGDGAHRPRDAGGRRRAEVRLRDGLPQGKPADRALAQDLATVARNHVQQGLVGPGPGQPELQVSRYGGDTSELQEDR